MVNVIEHKKGTYNMLIVNLHVDPDEIKTEINESVWISVFVDLLGCAK